MSDPKLVDETEVPADEPRFRVPPHFVVDEMVRAATAELQAGTAELAKQRESLSQLVRDAVRDEVNPIVEALNALLAAATKSAAEPVAKVE